MCTLFNIMIDKYPQKSYYQNVDNSSFFPFLVCTKSVYEKVHLNQKKLGKMCIRDRRRPKDAESLAIDILTFLTGISSRDGERFPILRRAVRTVTNSKRRGLLCVIEELRKEGSPLSVSIADHIESFTDYDFAHLLFSDGNIQKSISLEKQLNIVQVADLVLPDKGTSFEEYTTMELLSVAMLIVISTFALDFIHTDLSLIHI